MKRRFMLAPATPEILALMAARAAVIGLNPGPAADKGRVWPGFTDAPSVQIVVISV